MTETVTAVHELAEMRAYVYSGATRSYAFRRRQLLALRYALLKYEKEIMDALWQDLRKTPEEVYATETGMVFKEIRFALKNLRKWTRPARTKTNLLNFPSTSEIIHDPLGVVLIIAPWNYPVQLLLLPLVGAISGGNTVMLKPSELAPASEAVLKKIIRETFPRNYISITCGDGAETVGPMIRDFRFDHIFYTGSTAVGKIIYRQAADRLVPVTLELGGKNPAVIEQDADLWLTAKKIAMGKFLNAGQTCIAPDYLLVHASVKEEFLQKLREAIATFYGGSGGAWNCGKIINQQRFDQLMEFMAEGTVAFGGRHDRKKLTISPTLMEDVPLDANIMQEEIFGPLLPIFTYENMEEALDQIVANPTPLAFYLFTQNSETEKLWMERVRFGGGCVNNTLWHFTNHHLPFGGVGNSGIGAYHGNHSFYRFTHAKSVMKSPRWFDLSIKYPPYAGKMKWIKRLIR
jgi:aldehyde dehydrogenase (NAD+)